MINPQIQELIKNNLIKNELVLENIARDNQIGLINRICDGLDHTSLPAEIQNILKLYRSIIRKIPAQELKVDMRNGISSEMVNDILAKSDLKKWVASIRKLFFEKIFVLRDGKIDLNDELIALFGGREVLQKIYASINQQDFFMAVWDAFSSETITSYILKQPNSNDEKMVISHCLTRLEIDLKEFDYMVSQMQCKNFLLNLLNVLESTEEKLIKRKSDLDKEVDMDKEFCKSIGKYIGDITLLKSEIKSDLISPEKLNRSMCILRYEKTRNLFGQALKIEKLRNSNDPIKKIFSEALIILTKFKEFLKSASSLLFFSTDNESRNSTKRAALNIHASSISDNTIT